VYLISTVKRVLEQILMSCSLFRIAAYEVKNLLPNFQIVIAQGIY